MLVGGRERAVANWCFFYCLLSSLLSEESTLEKKFSIDGFSWAVGSKLCFPVIPLVELLLTPLVE